MASKLVLTGSMFALLAGACGETRLDAFRARDPESAAFLDHFLALFEHVFTGAEDRYVDFSRQLNRERACEGGALEAPKSRIG
jgi:hypothetical protein